MLDYKIDAGTHIKSNDNSKNIKLRIIICLLPFIFLLLYKNFEIKNLINIILSVSICFGIDIAYNYLILKQKDFKKTFINSYGIIDGLIISLIIPKSIPLYLNVVGIIMGSIICKLLFYKFKNTIFNTPLLCVLIVILISMVLGNNYTDSVSYSNIIFRDYLIKNILCIIVLAYLLITKTIKWEIVIVYLATFMMINYMVGGYNGLSIKYVIAELFIGNVLFYSLISSYFTTSPVTTIGKILYGLFLGILSSILIYFIPSILVCIISILIMNLCVRYLDMIGSISRFDFTKSIWLFVSAWLLIIVAGLSICLFVHIDTSRSVTNVSKPIIEFKDMNNASIKYTISNEKIKASIIIEEGKVISYDILSDTQIDTNYINKLIENQNNMDFVSSDTTIEKDLKSILKVALEDYNMSFQKKEETVKTIEVTEPELVKPIETRQDDNFKIKEKEVINNVATYMVEYNDKGLLTARIVVNNGKFSSFVIVNHGDEYIELDGSVYISKLLYNQDQELKNEQNNYSANLLKNISLKVLEDYNGGKQ